MPNFQVVSDYTPSGDQPEAIEALAQGVELGLDEQTLLGVTGSGKTFTMANVIDKVQPPHPGPGPQQDPGRPALRGVPGVFPQQRGGVFRLLLRLLPARGLYPPHGHLY